MNETTLWKPGITFHYADTNSIILGLLIEKLTGNSLHQELGTRITPSSEVISTVNASPDLFQISMAFKHLCGADTGSLHQPYDEAVA